MLSKSQIESFKATYGDKESRHLRNESQISVGIPFQLRTMREMRGWTQAEVAQKLGTTQNTISRLESSRAHAPNTSTLLRYAEVFDVALLVRFAPFSDFYDFNMRASHKSVAVPSFQEDLEDLEQQVVEQEDVKEAQSAQSVDASSDLLPAAPDITFGLFQSGKYPTESDRKPVASAVASHQALNAAVRPIAPQLAEG